MFRLRESKHVTLTEVEGLGSNEPFSLGPDRPTLRGSLATRADIEPSMYPEPSVETWCIAQCCDDERAEAWLKDEKRGGYKVWRPVLPWQRRRLGKPDLYGVRHHDGDKVGGVFKRSMFPGHLFIEDRGDWDHDDWKALKDAPYLKSEPLLTIRGPLLAEYRELVRIKTESPGFLAIVQKQEKLWEDFRKKPPSPQLPDWCRVGGKVVIPYGPLSGLPGKIEGVEKLDDRARISVLLNDVLHEHGVSARTQFDVPLTA
jgi:hypothetical protein